MVAIILGGYLALALLVNLLLGCGFDWSTTFSEAAKERAPLIDGIHSYQSIKEVRESLRGAYASWYGPEAYGEEKWESARKPPFRVQWVSLLDYSHVGFSGELTLWFYNNRLAETRFTAGNFGAFVEALAKQLPGLVTDKKEDRIAPYARVSVSKESGVFVGWQDARLAKEGSLWTCLYSSD